MQETSVRKYYTMVWNHTIRVRVRLPLVYFYRAGHIYIRGLAAAKYSDHVELLVSLAVDSVAISFNFAGH